MRIHVNFKSGTPVYLQIAEQVKYAAASGVVRAGDPLPSIRALAEELRVNRNTVAKSYAELERQGVLESRPGKGCVLSRNGSPYKKRVRESLLNDSIDAAVVQAYHFQVGEEEFVALSRRRFREFGESGGRMSGKPSGTES